MYINAFSVIYEPKDAQGENLNESFRKTLFPPTPSTISKGQLRRASSSSKMAMIAANEIWPLDQEERPFSIHIGTGLAMIEDTTKFLDAMIQYEEEALSPTQFIQSTHNTISGQLALAYQVHEHNFTFSQGVQSYDDAYLDAFLLANEHPEEEILVAGLDEINDLGVEILKDQGLLPSTTDWASEGAAFFRISKQQKNHSQFKILQHFRGTNSCLLKEIQDYIAEIDIENIFFTGKAWLTLDSKIKIEDFNQELGVFHTQSAIEKALSCELLKNSAKNGVLVLSQLNNYWSFWHITKCEIIS